MRTIQEHICLSAVIPTLDAAEELPATLAALRGSPLIGEIVVADGGSRDGTIAIARDAGVRVVDAPRGRGTQLAAGAAVAAGDWLFFVHADCRPLPGWEDGVRDFIAASPEAAGYFALALDDDAPAARRLERLVARRCRVLALPYGDQGLLIPRALYDAAGGFAAMPLMEDVDLARRLGRARLKPVGATMLASARRYRRDGYRRRQLRNLACLSLYFAGVSPARIARIYG
ncbi:MAG TPA: TIGR04283 family arsenosugar biosynthesis glycosyltransferase [Stellaceae bacterium]|nr:TIGR04283 family arsenosugar biosynthesis glycosyltransferase [Stellaceae bacterium]